MEIWSKCDICGRDIPVGELCYGLKKGNCICKDCCTGFENCTFSLAPAPTLTPPNEWVSVEDALPEVGKEVLVYWRNTSQKAEHFELTRYEGDHWFLLDSTDRPWIEVIAWMPLPAPPDRRPPEVQS